MEFAIAMGGVTGGYPSPPSTPPSPLSTPPSQPSTPPGTTLSSSPLRRPGPGRPRWRGPTGGNLKPVKAEEAEMEGEEEAKREWKKVATIPVSRLDT